MLCPGCNSNKICKNGFNRKISRQMYICVTCGKQFYLKACHELSRMRYPRRIISESLALYFCYGYSTRKISKMLHDKGINVSHVALSKWTKKFGRFGEDNEDYGYRTGLGGEALMNHGDEYPSIY